MSTDVGHLQDVEYLSMLWIISTPPPSILAPHNTIYSAHSFSAISITNEFISTDLHIGEYCEFCVSLKSVFLEHSNSIHL